MDSAKRAFVAASVAGLVAAVSVVWGGQQVRAAETEDSGKKASCYGINKCKGIGDCGGKGHSCAGKNECAGQGYVELEKDTCLKIKDGRLTPDVEKS